MSTVTLVFLLVSFLSGAGCTLAVLLLIDRRVMARPGARVEAARRLLDGGAR